MNAKEARALVSRDESPKGVFHTTAAIEAKGFLEATKSAEPLLEVIEKYEEALSKIAFGSLEKTFIEITTNKTDSEIAGEALSSSAQVVEKYKRETLGKP